jgi:uncharacterized coiled-coil protein SlyX
MHAPWCGCVCIQEYDAVSCLPETRQAVVADKSFTFDYLYDQASTQQDIYRQSVAPLVEAALAGYNATVFAYGQTGSGKTYTMGSSSWEGVGEGELGVLPRALKDVLEQREQRLAQSARLSMVLRASFIEIHNEELRDLLAHNGSHGSGASGTSGGGSTAGGGGGSSGGALTGRGRTSCLQIREDGNGGIYFAGAEEGEVTSFSDVRMLLEQGIQRRAVGATEMNAHSSRSHAIFTLVIEQHLAPDLLDLDGGGGGGGGVGTGEEEYITSKFHFVDLAGSERLKKTKAEGERLKEGININSGLLALGNVISALGDESKQRSSSLHVPYRDSKLTRMLQDSLGGNSRTVMIACVSPVESNAEESKSTLQYANRARNIKNTPVINRDPNSHLIAQLRKEIGSLRLLLREHGIGASACSLNKTLPPPLAAADGGSGETRPSGWQQPPQQQQEVCELSSAVVRLEVQVAEQAQLLDELKRAMAHIYTCTTSLEAEMQTLQEKLLVHHHQLPHPTRREEEAVAAAGGCKVDGEDGQHWRLVQEGFKRMLALVASIQQIEDGCRTKVVVHAAWLPAGSAARAGAAAAAAVADRLLPEVTSSASSLPRAWAGRTGGSEGGSGRVYDGHEGPAILRRFHHSSRGAVASASASAVPLGLASHMPIHRSLSTGAQVAYGAHALVSPRSVGGGGGGIGGGNVVGEGWKGGGGSGLVVPRLALERLNLNLKVSSSPSSSHTAPLVDEEDQALEVRAEALSLSAEEDDADADASLALLHTDRTELSARQSDMLDMDAVLLEKERLLHELVRNQRDFDTMRNTYESKMHLLQLSIRAIEEERDQTAKELESMDQRSGSSNQSSRVSKGHAGTAWGGGRDEDEARETNAKEKQRMRLRHLEDELRKLRKKVKVGPTPPPSATYLCTHAHVHGAATCRQIHHMQAAASASRSLCVRKGYLRRALLCVARHVCGIPAPGAAVCCCPPLGVCGAASRTSAKQETYGPHMMMMVCVMRMMMLA